MTALMNKFKSILFLTIRSNFHCTHLSGKNSLANLLNSRDIAVDKPVPRDMRENGK